MKQLDYALIKQGESSVKTKAEFVVNLLFLFMPFVLAAGCWMHDRASVRRIPCLIIWILTQQPEQSILIKQNWTGV